MLNSTVLLTGAECFGLDAQINPYYDNRPVDVDRATKDHGNIRRALEQAGVEVISVPPPLNAQDGVFAANWAIVKNGRALLSRLPKPRDIEEDWAESVLTGLGIQVTRLPQEWHYSGQGDSLICGNYLFAGSGYRSDARAQHFVADSFNLDLVLLHAVPLIGTDGQPVVNAASGWADSLFYDLDLAVSVIRDDLIAYCPDALDQQSRALMADLPIEKIIVTYEEATQAMACNLISTGETVIMSSSAPNLESQLRDHGLEILKPEVHELSRSGGYIRCVALTID